MQKAQVLLSGCARTWKSVRMASSGATLRNTLANKVAIVTASTDGIGLAIARRLAQDGAHVVISSRKQQNVDRTVAALKQEGLSVSGTVCHVGKAEDRKRLVATAVNRHGGVDILVSNAAVNPFFGNLMDVTEEIWDKFWKDAAQEEQAKQVMRVKRLGNPEECGGIVSFLCSEDASYINGETVVVGGGSPSRL
ncbi:dehydrogenase/reductase SDR family member 4 isoform X4 [Ochotona curzoniae]|uniref:dehydrogenase/reductase SDR family member 4 isoform X4 n=1 Tax=Ochotona curzoniae TaxID=130825 RepID=UPI001B34D7D1|nr:dehydrogenase/reductase SDR family member 4 isoform X4 [Ochotona curzoniae]